MQTDSRSRRKKTFYSTKTLHKIGTLNRGMKTKNVLLKWSRKETEQTGLAGEEVETPELITDCKQGKVSVTR